MLDALGFVASGFCPTRCVSTAVQGLLQAFVARARTARKAFDLLRLQRFVNALQRDGFSSSATSG